MFLVKIMSSLDLRKLSNEPTKIGHIFRKSSDLKIFFQIINKSWSTSLNFLKKNQKDFTDFQN